MLVDGEDVDLHPEACVGLTGDDALKSLPSLNPLRPVSTNDVFCNRELRMGGLKAIGFDMDYTLGELNS